MSRCNICGVEILDRTETCPLCHHVLEKGGLEQEDTYPELKDVVKRFRFILHLFLFLSIVLESFLVFVNLMVDPDFLWSVMVGFVLIYANVVIRLTLVGKSGYVFKLVSLVAMAVLVLLGIDAMTGLNFWSLNYVYPAGILVVDVGLLIMMIVNHRNWQSYMMGQILMILLSCVSFLFLCLKITDQFYLALVALAASVFIFLGTLILGDQRARSELYRRFHL